MQDDHVYRKTELVGSSSESLTNAIETAVERSIADPAQPRMVRESARSATSRTARSPTIR